LVYGDPAFPDEFAAKTQLIITSCSRTALVPNQIRRRSNRFEFDREDASQDVKALDRLMIFTGVFHPRPHAASQLKQPTTHVNYQILQDDLGTIIKIGVECPIDEKHLKSTLLKIADEHQDDAARDYLTSKYLYVRAYLISGAKQSSVAAGALRRYVPLRNPNIKEEPMSDVDQQDVFDINIDEAKKSLSAQNVRYCEAEVKESVSEAAFYASD
jgi:hypothetical protein